MLFVAQYFVLTLVENPVWMNVLGMGVEEVVGSLNVKEANAGLPVDVDELAAGFIVDLRSLVILLGPGQRGEAEHRVQDRVQNIGLQPFQQAERFPEEKKSIIIEKLLNTNKDIFSRHFLLEFGHAHVSRKKGNRCENLF